MSRTRRLSVWRNLQPLLTMPAAELLQHRYERFRYIDSLVAAHPDFGPKVEPKVEPKSG